MMKCLPSLDGHWVCQSQGFLQVIKCIPLFDQTATCSQVTWLSFFRMIFWKSSSSTFWQIVQRLSFRTETSRQRLNCVMLQPKGKDGSLTVTWVMLPSVHPCNDKRASEATVQLDINFLQEIHLLEISSGYIIDPFVNN